MIVETQYRCEDMELQSEVVFYTIADVMEMTHWSERTVQKMFNDPKFPSADFGKNKIVEAHALVTYFSRKHVKNKDSYWRKN